MSWSTKLSYLIRNLFSRKQTEKELDEELLAHLDLLTEENLRSGMGVHEARRAARMQMDGVELVKENVREIRTGVLVQDLSRDLRYGVRMLRKSPGFTALAVLVLSLSIGAPSAIFNLVNTLLLRPLDIPEPHRLMGVYSKHRERPGDFRFFSYPNFTDLREANTGFSGLAAHQVTLAGLREGEDTRRSFFDLVSSNYFSTMGIRPVLGRDFLPEEELPGSSVQVAIASYQLWQRRGGNPDFLGDEIEISGHPFTVVGIAPAGFTGRSALISPDVWLPLGVHHMLGGDMNDGRPLSDRANHALMLIGRMGSGIELPEINERLGGIAAGLESQYAEVNRDQALLAYPLSRLSIGEGPSDDAGVAALAAVLLGMSGVVLLIGCLNLANMQGARISGRSREFGVRLALGSGRRNIARQLLVEGLLLSLLGGAGGLVIAYWTLSLLAASISRMMTFNLVFHAAPDWRVITVTLMFGLAATVIFTLGPAWKLMKRDFVTGLSHDRGGSEAASGLLGRRNLPVLAEIALSLVLLTAAGLFTRAAVKASTLDPGFELSGGILLETDTSLLGYDEADGRRLYGELLARMRTLPGVEVASMAATVPFGNVHNGRAVYRAEDAPSGDDDNSVQPVNVAYNVVASEYFRTLGISLLQGRGFTMEEEGNDRAGVAVIDENLARELWPEGRAVGRYITMVRADSATEAEIVGVAGPVHNRVFQAPDRGEIYVPTGPNYRHNMNLHLRATSDREARALLSTVRREALDVHPNLPVLGLKTLHRHLEGSYELWILHAGSYIFTILGAVAIFLASIGIYGVRAYSVSQRIHEIGIRIAVGASVRQVHWLVLREGLVVAVAGVSLGLLLAAGTSQILGRFLYQVSATDPLVFGLCSLLLSGVALLACYLPARRAAGVDPIVALRYE